MRPRGPAPRRGNRPPLRRLRAEAEVLLRANAAEPISGVGSMSKPVRWGYRAYLGGIHGVRRNPVLFRLLFGFKPLSECAPSEGWWDWTTLALRSVLRRYCAPSTSLLDVGTGPAAALATYAALRLGCQDAWASDHLPWIVEAAQRQTRHLRAAVHCVCSDLFEAVPRRFDLIVFNAPYLPTQRARSLGLFSAPWAQERFDGGRDGCSVISRFLSELAGRLAPAGMGALGVNGFHVDRERVADLIAHSGLDCAGVLEAPLVRSRVYLLRGHER